MRVRTLRVRWWRTTALVLLVMGMVGVVGSTTWSDPGGVSGACDQCPERDEMRELENEVALATAALRASQARYDGYFRDRMTRSRFGAYTDCIAEYNYCEDPSAYPFDDRYRCTYSQDCSYSGLGTRSCSAFSKCKPVYTFCCCREPDVDLPSYCVNNSRWWSYERLCDGLTRSGWGAYITKPCGMLLMRLEGRARGITEAASQVQASQERLDQALQYLREAHECWACYKAEAERMLAEEPPCVGPPGTCD